MQTSPELAWALITVVFTTALVWLAGGPRTDPGALLGHTLGVLGFLMMIVTELAYSIRKRVPDRAWGPLQSWLRAHIFTGIVGPWLVLLHAGWRFAGLAGWATLATLTVVASGFVGRYFYAALPKAPGGEALSLAAVDARLAELERQGASAPQAAELSRLRSQAEAAPAMRRALALWHTVHVPLGLVMFTLAAVHVCAALYYTARLR